MEEVEERVGKLEAVLGRFIVQTDMALKRMEQDTATFKEELRRDQVKRDEDLKKFQKEVRTDQKQRDKDMQEFREEVRAGQQEQDRGMKEFREEVRTDQKQRVKEMNDFREVVRADQQERDKDIKEFRKEVRTDQQERDRDTKEFREEVRAGQQERDRDMREFREEVRAGQQERDRDMREFREEVRAGQQERDKDMREFREAVQADQLTLNRNIESIQQQIQQDLQEYKVMSNKRWGELANRLGTVVEDIVAPNLPSIAQQYFGCKEIDFFGLRIKRKNQIDEKGPILEFDAILVCSNYLIVNETKTKPDASDVKSFRERQLKKVFNYFPEYQEKEVIPVFSSLSFSESTLRYLTKNKIYAMSSKGDTMDILNFEAVQKKK